MANIIIYGGGFQAAAAASKAASQAGNAQIYVIIPYPVSDTSKAFGSIGTLGGQNYFDVRSWNGAFPYKGSFEWWYSQGSSFYSTEAMAARLTADVTKYSNVTVYYGYDICSFNTASNPYRISQVTIKKITRNSTTGFLQWSTGTHTLSGTVFIDASDDGRLTRLVNFGGTVGRYDWPSSKLDSDEIGSGGKPRQQVATLMFQVKNIQFNGQNSNNDMNWDTSTNGTKGVYGGRVTYANDSYIKSFNDYWGPRGFAIKPLNAAQDGNGSPNWWINTLLVFNVDGRAHERDRNTACFPSDMRSDYITVDQAWVNARNMLTETNPYSFMTALKRFGGFSNAELVMDGGQPKVGVVMYIRETIHMAKDSGSRGNSTYNSNYEVTDHECHRAGTSPNNGSDAANYATRIGLNYYWSDINAYKFEDMKKNGEYIWGGAIANKLRDDLHTSTYPVDDNSPHYPTYIPYNALTTNYVANLLIPGYAVGASSYAWAEMRVFPNLCVLGDAAGAAAAYAVNNNKQPLYFSNSDIAAVQSILSNSCNAKLEK